MSRPPRLLPRGGGRCTRCLNHCDAATLLAADGLCLGCAPVSDHEHWAAVTERDRSRQGSLVNEEKLAEDRRRRWP